MKLFKKKAKQKTPTLPVEKSYDVDWSEGFNRSLPSICSSGFVLKLNVFEYKIKDFQRMFMRRRQQQDSTLEAENKGQYFMEVKFTRYPERQWEIQNMSHMAGEECFHLLTDFQSKCKVSKLPLFKETINTTANAQEIHIPKCLYWKYSQVLNFAVWKMDVDCEI